MRHKLVANAQNTTEYRHIANPIHDTEEDNRSVSKGWLCCVYF